jgi:hypothetical protein
MGELQHKALKSLELEPWTIHLKQHWIMDVYLLCDRNIFPSIKHLPRVLASLLFTTCTAERSFSTLIGALKRI